jgi:hypothetical protein
MWVFGIEIRIKLVVVKFLKLKAWDTKMRENVETCDNKQRHTLFSVLSILITVENILPSVTLNCRIDSFHSQGIRGRVSGVFVAMLLGNWVVC